MEIESVGKPLGKKWHSLTLQGDTGDIGNEGHVKMNPSHGIMARKRHLWKETNVPEWWYLGWTGPISEYDL